MFNHNQTYSHRQLQLPSGGHDSAEGHNPTNHAPRGTLTKPTPTYTSTNNTSTNNTTTKSACRQLQDAYRSLDGELQTKPPATPLLLRSLTHHALHDHSLLSQVAYYQSWSAPWAAAGSSLDLAKIPGYVNVVVVSFAQPDCSYTKGSYSLVGTGLSFISDGRVVRDAIAALKAAQPNTRVLLAVGGDTYKNFASMNPTCIKNLVDDFGFHGVDLDYEPVAACQVSSGKVSCPTDAESVSVTTTLRNALPKGQYLLSTASWHVGMYGEGACAASRPASGFTGVNLAMARSAAGQQLDLINIMTYDAGNKASTGFDYAESYRAHRAIWKTQAIAIGVKIPPEAWNKRNGRETTVYVVDQGGTNGFDLYYERVFKVLDQPDNANWWRGNMDIEWGKVAC
eukprot:gene2730-3027_t